MPVSVLRAKLLDASGDTQVTADSDTLVFVLEEMTRVLAERLTEHMNYTPVDMGAVLDLSASLRWAAEEAIRINPYLDERKAA